MARLTEADRVRIETAVRDVESRTSCEFVAVLAGSSGGYGFIRWGVPALAALILPWLAAIVLPVHTPGILWMQLLIFALLATALQWSPLALRLVPPSAKEERARRAARAAFHDLALASTEGRRGIMLFVSEAEHHVEILVDHGIAEKIPSGAWQAIIDRFVEDVRRGRLAEGFERAIAACGALLAREFPGTTEDRNELPDRLVER